METWEQQEEGVWPRGDHDCTEMHRRIRGPGCGEPELPRGQLRAAPRTEATWGPGGQ